MAAKERTPFFLSARAAAIAGSVLLAAAGAVMVAFAVVIQDQRCGDSCQHPLPRGYGWEFDAGAGQWTAQLGIAGVAMLLAVAAVGLAVANRLRAAAATALLAIVIAAAWAQMLEGTSWIG